MNTKEAIRSFWNNVPFKGNFYLSASLNLLTVVVYFAASNFLPPVAPLLYGHPEGEAQLVPKLGLLLAPATAFLITLINVFLALLVKSDFLQKILVVSALLISLLTTITVLRIIFLVGSF
ncbi:MAG TPA: hypothetical protein VJ227_01035 [Patescibacteria group bacterium]|nr:hypothetical protein [Patescibacteria group bacterium]